MPAYPSDVSKVHPPVLTKIVELTSEYVKECRQADEAPAINECRSDVTTEEREREKTE